METRKIESFYPNGNIRVQATYNGEALDGEFKTFHQNGLVQQVANYKNDKLHGDYIVYDEFGDIQVKAHYREGLRHGTYTVFYPKVNGGGPCEISKYENDLIEGDKITFYDTGEVMTITSYKLGLPQTYPRHFDKDGNESFRN
ncbi:MAG: hypothetical protein IJ481_01675 [Alphaproteobacteria bacterium]|nr:hypothetical protein [Alphaproteobacteria bacterium]